MGNVSEEDKIKTNKYNAFMGTIAICIVYGILAGLLFLFIYFTDAGKELYSSLQPFIITFILGTIAIIIAITYLVYEWEEEEAPDKKTPSKDILKPASCPDFYKMHKTDETEMNEYIQNNANVTSKELIGNNNTYIIGSEKPATKDDFNDKEHVDYSDYKVDSVKDKYFRKKCIMDPNIYNNSEIRHKYFGEVKNTNVNFDENHVLGSDTYDSYNTHTSFSENQDFDKKKTMAAFTAMTKQPVNGASAPLTCEHVFPEYLAYMDAKEYANNNYTGSMNKYRCEWSKQCGVPWTEAGCD